MNNTFPYYITPILKRLRELPPDSEDERLRLESLLRVNIGDPDVLEDLLGHTSVKFDDFYGERSGETPDTGDTIRIFLSNFGSAGVGTPQAPLPEQIPIVPVIDYASVHLAGKSEEPIADTSAGPETLSSKSPEPAPLTESLVKILVKKGKYEEALQIISELNLKNPEKSIYFADQMRFLRKVLFCKSKSNT